MENNNPIASFIESELKGAGGQAVPTRTLVSRAMMFGAVEGDTFEVQAKLQDACDTLRKEKLVKRTKIKGTTQQGYVWLEK